VEIRALTFLDCFPTLFDWSEVPPLAFSADNPQASLSCIERETPADRKMFYRLVSAEICLAEETG